MWLADKSPPWKRAPRALPQWRVQYSCRTWCYSNFPGFLGYPVRPRWRLSCPNPSCLRFPISSVKPNPACQLQTPNTKCKTRIPIPAVTWFQSENSELTFSKHKAHLINSTCASVLLTPQQHSHKRHTHHNAITRFTIPIYQEFLETGHFRLCISNDFGIFRQTECHHTS